MYLLRKERTGFVEPARKSIGRLRCEELDGWDICYDVVDLPSRSCTFKIKESIRQVRPRMFQEPITRVTVKTELKCKK